MPIKSGYIIRKESNLVSIAYVDIKKETVKEWEIEKFYPKRSWKTNTIPRKLSKLNANNKFTVNLDEAADIAADFIYQLIDELELKIVNHMDSINNMENKNSLENYEG